MFEWLLRAMSRRGLALAAPLVPWLGDTAAARGLRRGLDRQLATMLLLNERLRIPPIDTMPVGRARRFAANGLSAFDAVAPAMDVVIDTAVPGSGGDGGSNGGGDRGSNGGGDRGSDGGSDRGSDGGEAWAGDAQPAVPVRIYRPHGAGRGLIVWFHGGGGVIGSVETSDIWTRMLAHETRCTVASVEYRLAPEHVHPAAVDDAIAAWAWACAGGTGVEVDPDRIAVGGDSFGGFLAARVAAHAAAAGPRKPALQILVYPMLDLSHATALAGDNTEGYLLTASLMRWFTTHYAPDRDSHRAASPAFAPHLAGQARAIVVTAGFDPLATEGRAYAERLRAAKVPVVHHHHASLIHGFISMTGAIDAARAAADQLFAAIRTELAP